MKTIEEKIMDLIELEKKITENTLVELQTNEVDFYIADISDDRKEGYHLLSSDLYPSLLKRCKQIFIKQKGKTCH